MLKKILLALVLVVMTTVARADDDMKTAASKAYVDTSVETLQDKIPAANQQGVSAGETVMTYTAAGNGAIGERGIYTGANAYNANSDADKLITASALNDTFTNLPTTGTTKLQCANLNDGCTLWTIVDQTAYGSPSKNLFDIATATTIYRNGTVQETKTATGYTLTNSSSVSNFILVNFGTVEELEGKTFVMSTTNTAAGSYGFLYADADGTNRLGAVVTNPITVSSENAQGRTNVVLKFFANIADSSAIFTYNDVQVEEGSTATTYEPY